jgi:adenylate kinase family enzyme
MDEKISKIKEWLGTGSINIFGEPFSGKDTQGKELARLLSARLISSGEILRSMSGHDDVKQSVGHGNQAPTEIYLDKVLPFLSKKEFSGHPLILSMVGRILGEVQPTIDAAEQSGHAMKIVVWLQLTEEEVWDRFKMSKSIGDRGKRKDV